MDFDKINESAGLMAGVMVDQARQKYGLSITDSSLQESEILRSPCGASMVRGYVLGAIREYHRQLRQALLASGIDVGPFSSEDDD